MLAAGLPGCGGSAPHPAHIEGPFGSGRAQFWIARSTGKPRAVVALLHGLSPDSGLQLRAWIREMQMAPAEASLAAAPASDSPFNDVGFSEPEFLWSDEDPPFPTEDPPFSEDF